jgi:hypothetical protein
MAADCLLVWDQRWLLALQHVRVCTEQHSKHVCLSTKCDRGGNLGQLLCAVLHYVSSDALRESRPDALRSFITRHAVW